MRYLWWSVSCGLLACVSSGIGCDSGADPQGTGGSIPAASQASAGGSSVSSSSASSGAGASDAGGAGDPGWKPVGWNAPCVVEVATQPAAAVPSLQWGA